MPWLTRTATPSAATSTAAPALAHVSADPRFSKTRPFSFFEAFFNARKNAVADLSSRRSLRTLFLRRLPSLLRERCADTHRTSVHVIPDTWVVLRMYDETIYFGATLENTKMYPMHN